MHVCVACMLGNAAQNYSMYIYIIVCILQILYKFFHGDEEGMSKEELETPQYKVWAYVYVHMYPVYICTCVHMCVACTYTTCTHVPVSTYILNVLYVYLYSRYVYTCNLDIFTRVET